MKIGDKVNLSNSPFRSFGNENELYKIISILPTSSAFYCRIKSLSTDWDCLVYRYEIERVITERVGGQLLLFEL